MISPILEVTPTSSPDSKANDASRRVQPSADKFAEHLQRPEGKRSGKVFSPPNSSKPFTPRPSKPEREFRAYAEQEPEAEPASAKLEDGEPAEADADESTSSDSIEQVACVTVAFVVPDAPSLVTIDHEELTGATEAVGDPQQPTESSPPVVELPLVGESNFPNEVHPRTDAVDGALATVEAESEIAAGPQTRVIEENVQAADNDIEVGKPTLQYAINVGAKQNWNQGGSQPSPTIEGASLNSDGGSPQPNIAPVPIKQAQAALVTEIAPAEPKKELLKEKIAKALLGGDPDPSTAGTQTTNLIPSNVQPIADRLSRSDSADEDSERRLDDKVKQAAAENAPILSPADAAQVAASTLPDALRREMQSHPASTAASPATPPITDAQHARLLQRVSRAFRSAEERGGEVQIRLSPPELGSMKLELSLSSGVLTAKLEVESQRAQTILLDSLGSLRERLADQGIRVEKFDVSLQQRDSSGQQPQQHSQQHSPRASRASDVRNQPIESAQSQPDRSPQRPLQDASRLNVIV
jgi:flagellar hook-length control protein FliK